MVVTSNRFLIYSKESALMPDLTIAASSMQIHKRCAVLSLHTLFQSDLFFMDFVPRYVFNTSLYTYNSHSKRPKATRSVRLAFRLCTSLLAVVQTLFVPTSTSILIHGGTASVWETRFDRAHVHLFRLPYQLYT